MLQERMSKHKPVRKSDTCMRTAYFLLNKLKVADAVLVLKTSARASEDHIPNH